MRAIKHFQYALLLLSSAKGKKKENKLFTLESSQQVKEEQKSVWVGILVTTTRMGSKLTKFFS